LQAALKETNNFNNFTYNPSIMTQNFEGWLGYGPEAAEGNMKWGSFEPKKWTEDDVDIKVTHCGVCGTDYHVLRSDWGTSYREFRPNHINFPVQVTDPCVPQSMLCRS
jgi:hypothetical protein